MGSGKFDEGKEERTIIRYKAEAGRKGIRTTEKLKEKGNGMIKRRILGRKRRKRTGIEVLEEARTELQNSNTLSPSGNCTGFPLCSRFTPFDTLNGFTESHKMEVKQQ